MRPRQLVPFSCSAALQRGMVRFLAATVLTTLGACASKPTSLAAGAGPARGAERAIIASSHAGRFARGAVAADHELASAAGAEMLALGGNAVDAAVAASFALSVVRPYSCGIGGGGFMVVHLPADPTRGSVSTAINYREVAPAAIDAAFYEHEADKRASIEGGKAVGVPGTVAGLLHALERYGTMDRAIVLAPAIRLARQGFVADADYARNARELIEKFENNPALKTRFAFVWERFLERGAADVGSLIRLPEQAEALERIAAEGARGFYEGPIAEAIVRAAARDGGVLSLADLRGYRVREAEPLRFNFAVWTVLGMPPPSSGGLAMAQALSIFELCGGAYEQRAEERWTPRTAHLFIESLRHAFADRARYLGDPAFVDVPAARLLHVENLARMAGLIEPGARLAPTDCGTPDAAAGAAPIDDGGTSHVSAVDQWGGAVACTETINLEFGSLLAVPEFGFCLNNEMDDFLSVRGAANAFGLMQSERNLPAPGKRPLSSMSPTIVLDEAGQVVAVAGASGGPRIITGTTQALLGVLVLRRSAGEAVAAPRLHHQWSPDAVSIERAWVDADAFRAGLAARGHTVREVDNVGVVQLIARDRAGGWHAASDPRKGGKPAGH
ncbi:MAG: gamma-glutamyltransferase [Phycisphaeraceae bacterium]|nr:gamma-glutamyltransferase [Phycisphaeraceae bacterium]